MSHNLYLDKSTIPTNARVLGIWVRIPRILFASDEGIHDDLTIGETKLIYVELTDQEWHRVYGNQAAIDALGQQLGPEIATALGGYVKAWHSAPEGNTGDTAKLNCGP